MKNLRATAPNQYIYWILFVCLLIIIHYCSRFFKKMLMIKENQWSKKTNYIKSITSWHVPIFNLNMEYRWFQHAYKQLPLGRHFGFAKQFYFIMNRFYWKNPLILNLYFIIEFTFTFEPFYSSISFTASALYYRNLSVDIPFNIKYQLASKHILEYENLIINTKKRHVLCGNKPST